MKSIPGLPSLGKQAISSGNKLLGRIDKIAKVGIAHYEFDLAEHYCTRVRLSIGPTCYDSDSEYPIQFLSYSIPVLFLLMHLVLLLLYLVPSRRLCFRGSGVAVPLLD